MYCKKCGKQIDDDSAFCVHCGNNINPKNKEQENEQNKPSQNTPTETDGGSSERDWCCRRADY